MKLTQDVYEETRKAAIAYGVPELALKMGIGNPGVLYNKLNHGDSCSHHKLTLADLIQIITITGNTPRPCMRSAPCLNTAPMSCPKFPHQMMPCWIW